jgi:hypothetical protein
VIQHTQIPDSETPPVFRRVPLGLLKRYAGYGVRGAKDELSRRRDEQAKEDPATARRQANP